MEIQKDLIWTEKVMWDVNESYNRKREKQSRISDCLIYLIGHLLCSFLDGSSPGDGADGRPGTTPGTLMQSWQALVQG